MNSLLILFNLRLKFHLFCETPLSSPSNTVSPSFIILISSFVYPQREYHYQTWCSLFPVSYSRQKASWGHGLCLLYTSQSSVLNTMLEQLCDRLLNNLSQKQHVKWARRHAGSRSWQLQRHLVVINLVNTWLGWNSKCPPSSAPLS